MASTITPQDLVNFARTQIKLLPIVNVGGFPNEPALTFANKTKLAIINEAYNYDWNRSTIPPFLTVDAIDEYPLVPDDYGWLERGYAELESDTSVPKYSYDLVIKRNLQRAKFKSDPKWVAVDRNRVEIEVIRVLPMPGNVQWRLYIDYQKSCRRITGLTCNAGDISGTFYPIPDTMEDVLKTFFLSFAYEAADDMKKSMMKRQEAEIALIRYRAYSSAEESETGFVPEYSLFLG